MKKSLIKLLFSVILIFATSIYGMAQVRTVSARFVETGTSTMENVLGFRITFSRLVWIVEGAPTTCSFKMEKSDDGVTWVDFTPTPLDCTSSGKVEFINTPFAGKFLRHNLTTLTGSGIISPYWDGFRGHGCGTAYRGVLSTEISSDPAPGEELTLTIPSFEKWKVHSARFELQTNSTVADRELFLTVSDDGNEYFRVFADVIKANQTGAFTTVNLGFVGTAGQGLSVINQPTDVRTVMLPVVDKFISGGHTFATETVDMQAGDDYGRIVARVEKCSN